VILIAKEFNQLPSTVARALARDPDQLDVRALPLLRYADRHAAFRRANAKELKAMAGDRYMKLVNENEGAFVRREMEAAAE
jgi:hypothetical protein